MTDCPTREQFVLRVDGELSRNDELSMDQHLGGCARCRTEMAAFDGLIGALAAPATTPAFDFAARALQADLQATRASTQSITVVPRRWRGGWAAIAATSAAAAALFFIVRPSMTGEQNTQVAGVSASGAERGAANDDRGFVARGAAPSADAKAERRRWVSLRVFRTRDGQATALGTPPMSTVRSTDGLLFAYTNAGPTPFSHLAIYAVDQSNHVYWYYPEFAQEGAGVDPVSIGISAGVDIELHDEVRHALGSGPLQIHALFSNQPIRVQDIERNPTLEPEAGVRYTILAQVE